MPWCIFYHSSFPNLDKTLAWNEEREESDEEDGIAECTNGEQVIGPQKTKMDNYN